jgi:hypothetical protein
MLLGLALQLCAADNSAQAELKNLSVDGQLAGDKARLVISADLKGLGEDQARLIYGTSLEHVIQASREKLAHTVALKVDVVQGDLKEVPLVLTGVGEVRQVTGEGLEDWSLRQGTGGARTLVLRLKKSEKPVTVFTAQITAQTLLERLPSAVSSLAFAPDQPTLFHGYVRVDAAPDLEVQAPDPGGLVPVEARFLPVPLRPAATDGGASPLAFRFQGAPYALGLQVALADPEARKVVLHDFKLAGQLKGETAAFTLEATARVKHPKGGSLDLLSGGLALTDVALNPDWRLRFERGVFAVVFDKAGEFPLLIHFNAGVRLTNGWAEVEFGVAPSALQPVVLGGLQADTQFRFPGAARPERTAEEFRSFLPADGQVRLAWKSARTEAEGKLFYSAEALAQLTVSPGLMRQTAMFECKVMQGELSRLVLLLRGRGEVTRVQGAEVLAWNLEAVPGGSDRRLTIQLNQPQKDQFAFQVQVQTALGAFPQSVEALQLLPEGATRFGGHLRVLNEGAVRLEVLKASGLSQISPEQYPQTDATKALLPSQTTQAFAYRFSGAAFELRLQADNILPELAVSQVLAYHLGETELAIDAEIELDIREAPLRELVLRVPRGFAIARLAAPGLSDHFLTETADQPDAQLRLVYGSPVVGRQVLQVRLERNKPLGETSWTLPRVEIAKAKSVRGHLGVSADPGFRLTPAATQGLTEMATAFFPRKVVGLQAAYRLSEPAWQARLAVERLAQSIQADAFHLFSVGEGIAYGSSVVNFLISGAPISAFKIDLSDEYFNVEFTGRDVRNWQKVEGGYQVQLHTPASGAYTLLATYERPFKPQGETLAFTGARPADAQSEQGHTIVISAYQFQVAPANVSSNLLALEPAEVPPEYRLFFDAPVLAAYRYNLRPFNLQLELRPLAQGETVGQVVDRASLTTRISKEGQVVTDARYFVKHKGAPHFRLTPPDGMDLWSVTVNGAAVVPVLDGKASLIPLPQRADANAVSDLTLKLAARAANPGRLTLAAPMVAVPVLLTEWRVQPDVDRRLVYRRGVLSPVGQGQDISGFAALKRLLGGPGRDRAWAQLVVVAGLLLLAGVVWRLATAAGVRKFTARHWLGGLLGLLANCGAIVLILQLADSSISLAGALPSDLTFIAPIQQSGAALSVEVGNVAEGASAFSIAWALAPAALAVVVWIYAWLSARPWLNRVRGALSWTLVCWALLRLPNGAPFFFLGLLAFVGAQLLAPSLRRWWRAPRAPTPPSDATPAAAAASLLVALAIGTLDAQGQPAANPPPSPPSAPVLADAIDQQVRVEGDFVFATANIRWQGAKGQLLPILHPPGVLTRITYPTDALRLVQGGATTGPDHFLLAEKPGGFDIKLEYQAHVLPRDGAHGFTLPTQYALVNRLRLTLIDLDVDVAATAAASVRREESGGSTNTLASLVLSPVNDAWISWKPRSRDTRREKAVFYAECFQVYVPGAGVVEGLHQVQLRPAQGELSEWSFDVPAGSTITDVSAPSLMLWRFDPDTRKLRVTLGTPQAKPFTVLIRSQIATGPLPFEQAAGLLVVNGAAGQVGLVAVATGTEVQLDDVAAATFAPINLEDFPASALEPLGPQFPGLTLRRAFRYAEAKGQIAIKAAQVEADVRVEAQQTLSLGEDRVVLAATLGVEITRAGIFKLSFLLPSGMDVESITGAALSHWTELKTDEGRLITLNLKGKTTGAQQFAISLAGPGVRAAQGWAVPRLGLREAAKHRGQLLIVPEQGMRLQVTTREGVTQLDPLKSGIRQKGVLAFRLLQADWRLALDLEQVNAWIQVTSLQHVTVTEAQMRVAANLNYQIENTGIKTLRVRLPAKAESVRFRGEQIADFLPAQDQGNETNRLWEIKLHRRVTGKYALQVTCHVPISERAAAAVIDGVQAQEVNLQRGFLTVQTGGRLQVGIDAAPAALQPAEWQAIPRALQQDLPASAADYTFRLVEADFRLPVRLQRHEAARLLEARVNKLTLTSVISDNGVMLTEARLELIPGDKRLLHLTLPARARFWFAFVNQNPVWPWREKDQVLIPLEQRSRIGEALAVEFFYSSEIGAASPASLDLELLGPRFDLPLENITWQVSLDHKWRLDHWAGTLQLHDQQRGPAPGAIDLETYIRNEVSLQKEKTREAEQMLSMANSLLERGDPQQARRAFQAAYGLSTHDSAFNEDARVQLHNLKMQQALVGLNVRQAKAAGEAGGAVPAPRALREGDAPVYTQQEAKQLLERNSAEENAVQTRLAERLVQQQDAAVASPAAIRASLPQQGRVLTFTRPLQVDKWADLKIQLQASPARAVPGLLKLGILAAVFLFVALLVRLSRPQQPEA